MRVLIVKLSSLGDVVHTLAALHALKKGLGADVKIDWLVEEPSAGMLNSHPMLDEVVVVRKTSLLRSPFKSLAIAKRLASKRYDMVLDFQGLLKSGVWVFLSRAKRRIGFSGSREFSSIFLNESLPPYDPDMHAVARYLLLAEYVGVDIKEVLFPIHIPDEAKGRAQRLLLEQGITHGESFICAVPSARWPTKLWSEKEFARLIRLINKRTGFKSVLVGSTADMEMAERIKGCCEGSAVSLAGNTGLKELAYILGLGVFTVSVDSGPMHVAAAVGSRVVSLFGPTAPWRTGPYGE
ncbi:MAG: glycosyltransferase family 9 protein, partial [Deltaproteobacteria bacterium]|nr:glycosyltransferase family 9 protein [Deltaproteobacteria bacterium]